MDLDRQRERVAGEAPRVTGEFDRGVHLEQGGRQAFGKPRRTQKLAQTARDLLLGWDDARFTVTEEVARHGFVAAAEGDRIRDRYFHDTRFRCPPLNSKHEATNSFSASLGNPRSLRRGRPGGRIGGRGKNRHRRQRGKRGGDEDLAATRPHVLSSCQAGLGPAIVG